MFLCSCFLCNDIIYHNSKISCWIDISYTIMKLYWYTQIYCWNAESCNSTKRYDCKKGNLSGSRCWRVLDYPTFSWQTYLSMISLKTYKRKELLQKRKEVRSRRTVRIYTYTCILTVLFKNSLFVETIIGNNRQSRWKSVTQSYRACKMAASCIKWWCTLSVGQCFFDFRTTWSINRRWKENERKKSDCRHSACGNFGGHPDRV